jgi:hypothetical protein
MVSIFGMKDTRYIRKRKRNQSWLREAMRCHWHAKRSVWNHTSYETLTWWYLMRYVGMVQGTQL